jgi:hypothetical protein
MFHALRLVTWAGSGVPFRGESQGKPVAGILHLGRAEEGLPTLAGMLELDGSSYHEVGGVENENLLYAVGYVLAEQLGAQKLKELCARARAEGRAQIPADWVLSAAGLTRETDASWGIRGVRLLGEPEQQMLQRCLRDEGPFRFQKN